MKKPSKCPQCGNKNITKLPKDIYFEVEEEAYKCNTCESILLQDGYIPKTTELITYADPTSGWLDK